MVLAGWMISDVPAAKVMALDAERMMLALEDPATFRRLLYAKNIAVGTGGAGVLPARPWDRREQP